MKTRLQLHAEEEGGEGNEPPKKRNRTEDLEGMHLNG